MQTENEKGTAEAPPVTGNILDRIDAALRAHPDNRRDANIGAEETARRRPKADKTITALIREISKAPPTKRPLAPLQMLTRIRALIAKGTPAHQAAATVREDDEFKHLERQLDTLIVDENAEEEESEPWLVPTWIELRYGTVTGMPEAGKSTLMAQLAVATAIEGDDVPFVQGALDVNPDFKGSPVYWASWEETTNDFLERINRIALLCGANARSFRKDIARRIRFDSYRRLGPLWAPPEGKSRGTPSRITPAGRLLFRQASMMGARLVVIDNGRGAFRGEENLGGDVRGFTVELDSFAIDHGCAMALVSHPTKTGSSHIVGSGDLHAAARYGLLVDYERDVKGEDGKTKRLQDWEARRESPPVLKRTKGSNAASRPNDLVMRHENGLLVAASHKDKGFVPFGGMTHTDVIARVLDVKSIGGDDGVRKCLAKAFGVKDVADLVPPATAGEEASGEDAEWAQWDAMDKVAIQKIIDRIFDDDEAGLKEWRDWITTGGMDRTDKLGVVTKALDIWGDAESEVLLAEALGVEDLHAVARRELGIADFKPKKRGKYGH